MDATTPPPLSGQPPYYRPAPTSAVAIVSLVLGILGFITMGFTSIPAVICGHIAKSQIRKSGGAIEGSGLALAGLLTGYLSMALILAVLAAIALPVFAEVQDRAMATRTMAQLKSIGSGCLRYAEEHAGRFPPKLEDLVPKYLPDAKILVCQYADAGSPKVFEYTGGSTSDPADKILAASPERSRRGRVYLYADGRTHFFKNRSATRGEMTSSQ